MNAERVDKSSRFEQELSFYLYVYSSSSHRVVLSFEWELCIAMWFEGERELSQNKISIDLLYLDF